MSTMLHASPVFGPVHSRRLGVSLGINLLPGDGKVCTFDCIYCECGLNAERRPKSKLPTRDEVREALARKLAAMQAEGVKPDVLTFAGNGEPTAHPQFAQIMDDTIALRDRYFADAKISVLSNGTMVWRDDVREALMRVDTNIQKLDTVNADYVAMVDRPQQTTYDIDKVVDDLCRFDGHVVVQTMFLDGTLEDGTPVCNTGEEYVQPWIDAVLKIRPERVMIYTIDRDTPLPTLRKASPEAMNSIAERLRKEGLEVTVSV